MTVFYSRHAHYRARRTPPSGTQLGCASGLGFPTTSRERLLASASLIALLCPQLTQIRAQSRASWRVQPGLFIGLVLCRRP